MFLVVFAGQIAVLNSMDPLAFKIERDLETDVLVAAWDDPEGGGITTRPRI